MRAAFGKNRGLGMSLLDGLRKGRSRQQSASGASSRRGLTLRSTKGLSADRIAAALGTLPVNPSPGTPSRSSRRIQERTSGVQAPQARARRGAPGGAAPSAPPPVVSRSAISPPVEPDSGRHRGRAERLAGWVQEPPSAAGPPRHASGPRSEFDVAARVGSAQGNPVPPVSVPVVVVPEGGRHRRPAPAKRARVSLPAALHGAAAKSHRLVVVGVVVLLVAVAAAFGLRVALTRPSAQPELVATTAQGQLGGPAQDFRTLRTPPSDHVL